MKSRNPVTRANRRYRLSMLIAMVAYMGTLFGSITWLQHGLTGPARIFVALLPAVPVVFIFRAALRLLRETDELEARTIVESFALAGAITAMAAVTYGFLEGVGFPKLSAWWTWMVLMGSWPICRFIVLRKYR